MHQTSKKTDYQPFIFVAGIILFGIIAFWGWVKLHYGFTFLDEGYQMVASWRISVGDHFIYDTTTGALRNFRLFNKLIFDIWQDITLLGFRKIQFLLTFISIVTFVMALFNYNRQYWYLPFIFSIFAFTGLDPMGATSNLNYYTYPHLFLVLHIACLLFGIRVSNTAAKSLLFILSGVCIWGISLSLLHLSPMIASPFVLYFFVKFLGSKQIEFRLKDLALVITPFFLLWAVFLTIYNKDLIHSVLTSLNLIREYPVYSSGFIRMNWSVLSYIGIMLVFAFIFFMVLNTFRPYKIIYLILLSTLAYYIVDTSVFGLFKPYWKDWYARPMWFAGLLVSFHLFFWLFFVTRQVFLKKAIYVQDVLAILLMIPATFLFILSAFFSGLGVLLILHCAIPTVTAMAIVIINHKKIISLPILFKLVILAAIFTPFYYTTAWSDWNFTYCDVKPKHANAVVTDGFLKGIKTNGVYKKINDWIIKNTTTYSNENDFIISYVMTPMVYMIAKRRPAIENSFLNPPNDLEVKNYQTMIDKMRSSKRTPVLVFVFDNSPALNTINEKKETLFDLKGNTYAFYAPCYYFSGSEDPLAKYINENMVMVESLTYADFHVARCFVDKKRLWEKSFKSKATEFSTGN